MNGLEGLVAELLSQLTERPWHVARGGIQAGKDIATRGIGELNADVECKRFKQATSLSERELIGELVQATSEGHRVELWVLVASRSIPVQLREALERVGIDRGVFVAFLDAPVERLGLLVVLLAQFSHVAEDAPWRWPGAAKIADSLKRLRRHQSYKAARKELSTTFAPRALGYATLRRALNDEMMLALTQRGPSLVLFGQDVTPLAPGVVNAHREQVVRDIELWWTSWPLTGAILCVHGEQGTGKTWAVASWLLDRFLARSESGPLILWCGHLKFDRSPLLDLASRLLRAVELTFGEEFFRRRVKDWAAYRQTQPAILMVIDGLNERANRNEWRTWLTAARFDLQRVLPGIGVVLTARTSFWRQLHTNLVPEDELRLPLLDLQSSAASPAPIQAPAYPPPTEVEVPDFTAQELDEALRLAGHEGWDPAPEVRTLMQRPKYFARAIRQRTRIQDDGDLTAERLLWEDLRKREEERDDVPLSNDAFQAFLLNLARQWRERSVPLIISRADAAAALSPALEVERELEDLISSEILEPQPGSPGLFTLHRRRLAHALGLLLVERTVGACSGGAQAVAEAVEREVEELGDSELGSEVIAFAVCIALASAGPFAPPDEARLALLSALAKQRNGAEIWIKAKPWTFFPLRPDLLLGLAESVWSSQETNFTARERIGYCFACIAETWIANHQLVTACEEWLGLVHPAGFRFMGRDADSDVPKPEIQARLQALATWKDFLTPSPRVSLASSQQGLDLARLALFIASHAEDASYAQALVNWAVSRAVLGPAVESTEVAWVARFGFDKLLLKLREAAQALSSLSNQEARLSAANLYRIEGAPASLASASLLDSRGRNCRGDGTERMSAVDEARRLADQALDPSRSLAFSRGKEALAEIDPREIYSGAEQTRVISDLEAIVPALCRTDADSIARFYRKAARAWITGLPSDPERDHHAPESAFLLLQRADKRSLRALVSTLEEQRPAQPEKVDGEWDATGLLLASTASAREQLQLLLARTDSDDDRDWLPLLTPFSAREVSNAIIALANCNITDRRRYLAFPWKERTSLTDQERESVWEVMKSGNLGIFAVAPVIRAKDPELLRRAIGNGSFNEGHLTHVLSKEPWARAGLAEASLDASLSLAARSWVVAERGLSDDSVREWIRDADLILAEPVGRAVLEQPSVVSPDVLTRGLDLETATVSTWITSLKIGDGRGRRLAGLHPGVVEALLLALLDRNDQRALELVKALETPNRYLFQDVSSRLSLPFRTAHTSASRSLLLHFLDRALSDDALQHLVHLAVKHRQLNWLHSVAASTHSASRRFERARSLALIGLGPASESGDRELVYETGGEDSWLTSVSSWSRRQRAQDAWARHWFRIFLSAPKRAKAWAAFQLFVRCADRRCAFWVHEELTSMEESSDYRMRHRHFELNLNALNRKLEEVNSDRKQRLFGWQIPRGDLRPWKENWHLR